MPRGGYKNVLKKRRNMTREQVRAREIKARDDEFKAKRAVMVRTNEETNRRARTG